MKKGKTKVKTDGSADMETANTNQAQSSSPSMAGEGAQTVIQTNIFCDAGRKKVESMLKKQDGIFDVKTNIQSGELSVRYSSDGISYTSLLNLINAEGFIADGDKPKAGTPANPCKK